MTDMDRALWRAEQMRVIKEFNELLVDAYIAASVQLCREVAKSMLAAKPVKEESNG